MSHPAPLQAFLAGLSIPIPVYALTLLNGNVFGVSGFIHGAAKGSVEAAIGAVGLVLGGIVVAQLDGNPPSDAALPLSRFALSGLLVGLGTKLSNGCTSGHMVCGLSRLSLRSLVATVAFFCTGVITAQLLHSDLPAAGTLDWTLGPYGAKYLVFQALPLAVSFLLYALAPTKALQANTFSGSSNASQSEEVALLSTGGGAGARPYLQAQPLLRSLACLSTSVQFALALQLSGLTDPIKVLSFLLLPFHKAFDPSLPFLAAGALPLGIFLHHYAQGSQIPKLGGKGSIPTSRNVDVNLVGGAAIFGVGWGITGICPGPGLVNLGRAIAGGSNTLQFTVYLGAVVAGGYFA